MKDIGFQYAYRRVKAVLFREWKLIFLTAFLSTIFAVTFNLLVREVQFKATVYMISTTERQGVSVLSTQFPTQQYKQSTPIDVLKLKIKFPKFYRGLKDTSLMYEVLSGRVSGILKPIPGVYTERSRGTVKCPCSKKFKVVVYDTLKLWSRLASGSIRISKENEEMFPEKAVLFTLEYTSPDKRWAKNAAEVVAHWIIQKNLEDKKSRLLNQRKKISELMDMYKKEIERYATELQNFKRKMRYPELTEEKVLSTLSELKNRQVALERLRSFILKGSEDTVFVDVKNDILNGLQTERTKLILQIKGLETAMGKEHPRIKDLRIQLDELNSLILASVEKNLKYINDQRMYYKKILPEVLKEQAELLTIQRNMENAEDFYIVLGQRLNDTDVQIGSLIPDVSILGGPDVRSVGMYRRSRFAAVLGLLVGLIVGMALAFFKDMTTDVLLDEESLFFPNSKTITLPAFSRFDLLPYQMVKLNEIDSSSPALNEFRKLLFDIEIFSGLKEIVAITSTQTGEGKTFISANLASAAALSGVPVLLIDGDVRAKGLSELFDLADAEGYANGRYEPYHIHPYLYVLPVGNSNEDHLLVFRRMLNNIKNSFEHLKVIIDLPPLIVSPEIKLLGDFAVKYVLVLRYNYTLVSNIRKVDLEPDIVILNYSGKVSSYYKRYYNKGTLSDKLKRLFM